MKTLILLASVLTLSCSAFSGVYKFGVQKSWQHTYENNEIKCSIDIVQLTSGKFKSEVICFNK